MIEKDPAYIIPAGENCAFSRVGTRNMVLRILTRDGYSSSGLNRKTLRG